MVATRKIEGTGEVFAKGVSLGIADYDLTVFITPRGKGADGTLTFHDAGGRDFGDFDLTVKLVSGVTFKLAVTSVRNGRISVSSNGPVPGL